MLKGDHLCHCGKIIDKRWYKRHLKGPAHKRRLVERRQPKPIKEVKITNFHDLLY